ncbi:unnamed protein product [Linum trigynum]|uniref:Peptide N-acetyl-beta-D-glucosaminyl asparaginase amidase A N-terminal domain-containing protein n=1 Tax=Linum trigynum TaxID=586398 RepID=A0AAV2DX26_9ROSI
MTTPLPSPASTLPLLFLLLLLHPFPAIANLHNLRTKSLKLPPTHSTKPTEFFEVTKPISLPNTIPCIHHIFTHDFASTFVKPPFLANYTPPSHCPSSHGFSKIVLEWNATCKGRQFDRIFGLWLGGVELLRSCTAEPRPNGILWTVRKDVTKYSSSLLSKHPQDLVVFLGNIVDGTYTGIYHVNVSIYFYPASGENSGGGGNSKAADLIMPISRNVENLNDGLWFQIENSSTRIESNEFTIPSNAYRAVLEVYVSPHQDDEFWYTNYPNDYIVANNLTSTPGNGPFREVVVSLDGVITVGAVWPFTVIYTGGINPLLWRPISGIGSFDLPTYDIELTPVLGNLLDGKAHSLGFSVTNGLSVWFVDANLHLWVDREGEKTGGKLVTHGSELGLTSDSNFTGLNGKFETGASRWVSTEGWVKSSSGNITTRFDQRFSYSNSMEMGKEGDSQRVKQRCNVSDKVSFSGGGPSLRSTSRFSVELYTDSKAGRNNTVLLEMRLALGLGNRRFRGGKEVSRLGNLQRARGDMVVQGDLVSGGFGATKQWYNYGGEEEEDGLEKCYFRDVSSKNYTIVHDRQGNKCHK